MKFLIFTLVFLIACVSFPQQNSLAPHSYVLRVTNPGGGYASATIIGPNKVLTPAHVFIFKNTKIGGYLVDEVLKVDFKNDCMLLTLKDANFTTYLKPEDFATDIALGETVITAGFPFGDSYYDWMRVSKKNPPYFDVNRNIPQGSSGSPVFNTQAKFVGIIVRKPVDNYGGAHTRILDFVFIKQFIYQ